MHTTTMASAPFSLSSCPPELPDTFLPPCCYLLLKLGLVWKNTQIPRTSLSRQHSHGAVLVFSTTTQDFLVWSFFFSMPRVRGHHGLPRLTKKNIYGNRQKRKTSKEESCLVVACKGSILTRYEELKDESSNFYL